MLKNIGPQTKRQTALKTDPVIISN